MSNPALPDSIINRLVPAGPNIALGGPMEFEDAEDAVAFVAMLVELEALETVGTQQAAIPDATHVSVSTGSDQINNSELTTALTEHKNKINAILAVLRTQGRIAT